MTDKPEVPMTDEELETLRRENEKRRKRLEDELNKPDGRA